MLKLTKEQREFALFRVSRQGLGLMEPREEFRTCRDAADSLAASWMGNGDYGFTGNVEEIQRVTLPELLEKEFGDEKTVIKTSPFEIEIESTHKIAWAKRLNDDYDQESHRSVKGVILLAVENLWAGDSRERYRRYYIMEGQEGQINERP